MLLYVLLSESAIGHFTKREPYLAYNSLREYTSRPHQQLHVMTMILVP